MAELFRHTDEDGARIEVQGHPDQADLVILVRDVNRNGGVVGIPAADALRLLIALCAQFGYATVGAEDKVDTLLPSGRHHYWSTHCRHGNHELCSATSMVRDRVARGPADAVPRPVEVSKTAAECKTCAAPCICPCHDGVTRSCPGCEAFARGADRLDYHHLNGCPSFDAFYDASDEELAAMVPPVGGTDEH